MKSVLTKVELGDVDAGMVYVTDVKAAGSKVKGVKIPAERQRLHRRTRSPPSPRAATRRRPRRRSSTYVLSPAGQTVLTADGFESALTGSGAGRPDGSGARAARAAAPGGRGLGRARAAAGPGADRGGFLVLPLVGLVIRAPWGSLGSALASADAAQALRAVAVDRDHGHG